MHPCRAVVLLHCRHFLLQWTSGTTNGTRVNFLSTPNIDAIRNTRCRPSPEYTHCNTPQYENLFKGSKVSIRSPSRFFIKKLARISPICIWPYYIRYNICPPTIRYPLPVSCTTNTSRAQVSENKLRIWWSHTYLSACMHACISHGELSDHRTPPQHNVALGHHEHKQHAARIACAFTPANHVVHHPMACTHPTGTWPAQVSQCMM